MRRLDCTEALCPFADSAAQPATSVSGTILSPATVFDLRIGAQSIGWNLRGAFAAKDWVREEQIAVRVDILKVRNKSTPLLKQVDRLAKASAQNNPAVGKIGRARIKGGATMFHATGQELVIKIVRSKTVGPSRENRFVFEVFDEATADYASKHFAYCTPSIGARLHPQRGFRVKMNHEPDYPQIL